jgi:hypothetical protein
MSSTRPLPQALPARLVPPPRGTTGTSNSRAAAIAAITSSMVFGRTTPTGMWR